MRCKKCGRVMDEKSRFCTYCDNDNYPQMNKVNTKTTISSPSSGASVRQSGASVYTNNNKAAASSGAKKKKSSSWVVVAIIGYIIYLILMQFMSE